MKNEHTYLINSRLLTTFNSLKYELNLNKKNNYLFDLSYLGILNIQGDKAIDFLQGQVTCDVHLVSDIQMVQGAQCNLKGRILSLFDLINWNGLKMVVPKDIMEQTKNALIKTAQLSKVIIEENNGLKAFGFYLQNQDDISPNSTFLPKNLYALAHSSNYSYYHLGNGFYIFIIKTEMEHEFIQSFEEKKQLLGSLPWHTLRLSNKQLNIYPESRGLFLPHRLSLHQTQYLSFNKGCYKGQEIIARTHYKATLKHELRIYSITTNESIYSGQRLLDINNKAELGELIDFSILENGTYLIAVSIIIGGVPICWFEGHSQVLKLNNDH